MFNGLGTDTTVVEMMPTLIPMMDGDLGTELGKLLGRGAAGGLCLAIPALMFYRYLRGLIADYVIEMEQQAMALLDTLDAQTFVAPVAATAVVEQAPKPKPAPRPRRSTTAG